ncbi:HupE/UreJ family protein [Nannocystis sp.]|uniref:HupE/UreJ family protein n=1 Tax=Nannocystis sp. TaxID=1962667 RepID=UPI0025CF7FBB|nr:HupE/UreJ family protein [Nannocystis sp.]MBK7828118.1 HupE/UreJ family protein [Nannocystis sp.]
MHRYARNPHRPRRRGASLVLAITPALLLLAAPAHAHEFRAGVLLVDIDPDGALELRLELPPDAPRPRLELPVGCEIVRAAPTQRATCSPAALRGAVTVHDLSPELELVAHLRQPGQPARTQLLHHDAPSLPLTPNHTGLAGYLRLGVQHILGGPDHLLFVVGLALWVRGLGPLLATLTAFTAAHSLTLALAALSLVRLPQPPVEACIAVSLVLLARAIVRGDLSQRTPWRFAGACGLLHGLGFAGALADIGLPPDAVVGPLAAFNLGVELGQVVALMLVGLVAAALLRLAPRAPLRLLTAYLIGGLATTWTVLRLLALGNPV